MNRLAKYTIVALLLVIAVQAGVIHHMKPAYIAAREAAAYHMEIR